MSKSRIYSLGGCVLAALVSVSAFVFVGGCGSKPDITAGGGSADRNGQSERPVAPSKPKPLLEDWPAPAAAIVLSGEQYGYLEPCGCSDTQSGGISRRADLFRQIEERNWPVTAFDLGDTIRRDRRQSQIKFETTLSAFRDMHYRAVALGAKELGFGPDYLLTQHAPPSNGSDASIAFLGANILFYDVPELEGGPLPWKVVTVDGTKIGVTAVLGKSIRDSELLKKQTSDISIRDPQDVLPDVVQHMQEQQPDLMVLLSHADLDESRQLAEEFPDFDLVLSAGGPEDPDGRPTRVGETMLVTVGHKGKYVGVVGFYPDDAEQRLRFELVDLDKWRFQDTEKMRDHMRFYQHRLREEQLVATELPIAHPSGNTFVGARKCGECHTKAYDKWKTSGHARAFYSLEKGHDAEAAISRIHDAECLACHVTGWDPQKVLRYESGYISEEFLTDEADKQWHHQLRGQQCENCHGPGSRHVELEEFWERDRKAVEREDLIAGRREMHLTTEMARDITHERSCYRCHDLDNSPDFDFEKYWEEVRHPWRD